MQVEAGPWLWHLELQQSCYFYWCLSSRMYRRTRILLSIRDMRCLVLWELTAATLSHRHPLTVTERIILATTTLQPQSAHHPSLLQVCIELIRPHADSPSLLHTIGSVLILPSAPADAPCADEHGIAPSRHPRSS